MKLICGMIHSYQTRRESKAFPRRKPRAPPKGRTDEGFPEGPEAPKEIPRQCGPEGGPVACDEEKPFFHNSFDKNNILYNLPNFFD